MGLNLDEQKAVERFQKDVVGPSQTKLVVLDFWAEWCGPCKALGPVLEKVCGEYADRGVILAKLDVDKEQFIASQFQVRSIPTVYAIFQGQPVADLTPMRSESQLRQALDQLLSQLPVEGGGDSDKGEARIDEIVAMGEAVLAEGDAERAVSIFQQIFDMAPDNAGAASGLIRALVAAGRAEDARAAWDALGDETRAQPAVAQAHSAIELAATKVDTGELDALRKGAAERPADAEAQFAFAQAAFAAGERDEAAEVLLKLVETDPEWNDGAARAKLLQIFEAVGIEDPWVQAQRRKLSLLLFG